ncbi:hypothetical protein LZ575_03090 [Antarcticibacterium sp. 1MA-6-2]|uniref:hypothetical protein n=1 Tax=Antarcticibacterium sp. 1MA-6-2 TaxID=2908210 RepID=UPI001F2CEEFC|nr:hypothetical protein [Antarcticibacterium sp. 1MA-6-2]UJH91688.1 hypothetical protein LZ575_03090 [Antarcticibacterium sp. 1MA-6-2]
MKNPRKQENLKPFKEGEDSRRNLKGRPRKKYSEHIADLQQKGYQAPTKTEYFDMMGLLLAMEEKDLKEFEEDQTRPYWIRLIVIDLNSKSTRQRMMSDYRDWLFGRAEQKTDITSKGEKILKEEKPDLTHMTLEELKALKELQNKAFGIPPKERNKTKY